MNKEQKLNIDLNQMIMAIETAVSLVGMTDTNHGKRVGYIASQLSRALGFNKQDTKFALELGLLHDCGVSTEHMHLNLVHYFDWVDAYIHCETGYNLLKSFEPLRKFATPILYHHTKWSEIKKLDISKFDAQMANLVFLSDRIDILCAAKHSNDILLIKDDIVELIKSYSDSYFSPTLIKAFLKLERMESFWIGLETRHVTSYIWELGNIPSNIPLSISQVKQLSLIMAYIVDQKSSFTAQHSVRVADISKFLAYSYGLSEYTCQKIEIAGLLHDLGKLHVPDEILDKPAPLNKEERAVMIHHCFETYKILHHIKGLDDIACWAAFHHEGINGDGYPFHPASLDFSIEARIIAVADIFQALVQDRPYKKGMKIDKVLEIINKLRDGGKLDKAIVDLINDKSEECYKIATGSDLNHNEALLSSFSSGKSSIDRIFSFNK